ncbi:MAG: NADH-quinone oxidoreductase subunit A [Acidobacteriia bacterium]|jgi:NADH-quinone oxidoreductase subunit A|nr:NADH-quinone oxidoreductase subunit A [Terriglobia bacterium]
MPTTPAEQWLPVLIQATIAAIIAAALVTLTFVIGRKVANKVKDTPYECGINPLGDARGRFSVKFYLVAMLFILFDIEAIFLYPWAVVYKQLKMFAFVEMLLFVGFVMSGFFYIWKKGVLDWAVTERDHTPHTVLGEMTRKGFLEEVAKR